MTSLGTHFDQFVQERTHLVNVTPKTREWYQAAWKAFQRFQATAPLIPAAGGTVSAACRPALTLLASCLPPQSPPRLAHREPLGGTVPAGRRRCAAIRQVGPAQHPFADGSMHKGFCSPQDDSGLDYLQPVIITGQNHVPLWPRVNVSLLGGDAARVFPVRWRALAPVDGAFREGTIDLSDVELA